MLGAGYDHHVGLRLIQSRPSGGIRSELGGAGAVDLGRARQLILQTQVVAAGAGGVRPGGYSSSQHHLDAMHERQKLSRGNETVKARAKVTQRLRVRICETVPGNVGKYSLAK